jgi:APA family basic amino acid/polyamine antiporter
MVICTALYVLVAVAAIGAVPVSDFAGHDAPLAHIIEFLGQPLLAAAIAAVAAIAVPTVILAFLYGQSRIFYVMARDGLMPKWFASVNEKRGAPVVVTLVTAALVSVLAGLLPLGEIAALANAGTLAAFIAVGVSLMILRAWSPETPRPYRTPMAWLVAPAAILGCIYLFFSLPPATQGRFFIWMFIGLAVYGALHVWRWRKTRPSPA